MKKILLFLVYTFTTTSLYAYNAQDTLKFASLRNNQVTLWWYYHLDNIDEKACLQKYGDNDSDQWENLKKGYPFELIFTAESDKNNPNKCTVTCSSSVVKFACLPFETLSTLNPGYKAIHDELYSCSIMNGQVIWPLPQAILNAPNGEQYFWIDHPVISTTTKWQGFCGPYDSKYSL